MTVAPQAPLSMGFSEQEDWSGLPCPPPGNLPDRGIILYYLSHQGSPTALRVKQRLLRLCTHLCILFYKKHLSIMSIFSKRLLVWLLLLLLKKEKLCCYFWPYHWLHWYRVWRFWRLSISFPPAHPVPQPTSIAGMLQENGWS